VNRALPSLIIIVSRRVITLLIAGVFRESDTLMLTFGKKGISLVQVSAVMLLVGGFINVIQHLCSCVRIPILRDLPRLVAMNE